MARKNAKQKASMASSSVNKAQNEILKKLEKRIREIESDVESKYNVSTAIIKVSGYDGASVLSRALNITEIPIAPNTGNNDFAQRIGDQVTLKHIDFNYSLSLPYTGTNTYTEPYTTCRVMVFWDNQPMYVNSAGTSISNPVYWPQLLQDCTSGTTADPVRKLVPLSQRDWDSRKRFSILHDQTHTLSAGYSPGQQTGGSTTDGGLGPRSCTGVIKFNKNYNGQKIRYVAGGQTVQNRKLYYAAITSGGVPTLGPTPTFAKSVNMSMSNRVIYSDA